MLSHATRTELAALVGLACRAPSVHNTQPWLWRVDGSDEHPVVEVYADTSRRLPATDPAGRNLLVSCGAALHHLRVGAAAHGWVPTVDRLPDVRRGDLLARVSLQRGEVSTTAARDLAAIAARVTDRRRFTSWPVPDSRVEHLAATGSREGATVVPLLDLARRHRTDLLFLRARAQQTGDRRLHEEQRSWVDHGARDGVPAALVPAGGGSRFEDAPPVEDGVEHTDGVLVVGTAHDAPLDHLRAGEALSAVWLHATTDRLSVVPLSQVVEVPETRAALRHEVLDGALHPQLVVRIGWQEIARSTLPRTPRRDVDDVLLG
ncbi:NAD(P)H nitroreductase [Nocardioides sp. IC4_145]|uniref:Acg family FMN-binding oxidoreductase n=1 Tax=Nocardioides sp. IC4_145 TaxID=2714037 RepID=UPI00140BBDEE|nr:NAD(P)H nitroreductase [Nocardioides sp. IC4_145]NHC22119.1 NAD(P)H nitroreductase [Nocardioides sp. IC4_145]